MKSKFISYDMRDVRVVGRAASSGGERTRGGLPARNVTELSAADSRLATATATCHCLLDNLIISSLTVRCMLFTVV